jgi:DNA-binding MarR family transcriptional regulator
MPLQWVDRQSAADELLRTMASIRRSGRRNSERPSELWSLTGAQIELVRLVRRSPGISIADAARQLRLAPNTISTLVRQLCDRGLLHRRVDASDRRVGRLDLSTAIRRKVDDWRDRRVVALSEAMGRLSRKDQRVLVEALPMLAVLAEHLEREEPEG